MKVTIIDNRVTATAETWQDIEILMTYIYLPTKVKRTYTKHNGTKHKKECPVCHKMYKGLKLHTYKKHNKNV